MNEQININHEDPAGLPDIFFKKKVRAALYTTGFMGNAIYLAGTAGLWTAASLEIIQADDSLLKWTVVVGAVWASITTTIFAIARANTSTAGDK